MGGGGGMVWIFSGTTHKAMVYSTQATFFSVSAVGIIYLIMNLFAAIKLLS